MKILCSCLFQCSEVTDLSWARFFKFYIALKVGHKNVVGRALLMCSQLNAMSAVNTFVPDAQFSMQESMISKEEMLYVNNQFYW